MSSTVTDLITVLDPRTGDVVTRMPIAEPSACDDAVARAARAAAAWARTAPAERAAAVAAAAADVRAAAGELAELNERETGKLRDDARGGVDAGAGTLVQYAELGPVHRGPSLQGAWSATDLMVPQPAVWWRCSRRGTTPSRWPPDCSARPSSREYRGAQAK